MQLATSNSNWLEKVAKLRLNESVFRIWDQISNPTSYSQTGCSSDGKFIIWPLEKSGNSKRNFWRNEKPHQFIFYFRREN